MRILIVLAGMLVSFSAFAAKSLIPPHEVVKTKNGAEIYYFKSPTIPLFQVELVFDTGGSVLDPDDRSGLAFLSSIMAKKGVPGMDEDALSRKIDDIAAGIDISAEDEDLSVSAYGLNEHAGEILNLMFSQISTATFPKRPFQRLKANHLDGIKQLPDSAGELAGHALNLIVFNGTPYARPGLGLRADIERITLDEVKGLFPSMIRTDRLKVLVIGGKSRKEVLEPVIRGIESLECRACGTVLAKPRARTVERWKTPAGHVVVLDRPGISEAHVRMGLVGPSRQVPEYYDLIVAETILGGNFGSRLNDVIREKLSLSYGIGAGFKFGWRIGSFHVATSTRNAKIDELLIEVNRLLAVFVEEGPTEQEIAIAKDYLTGSFPIALQNLYSIASTYFEGRINGLDSNFLDEYQTRISATTRESVRAAVKKHLKLGALSTVVVGDAKAITREMKKARIKHVVRQANLYL